MPAVESCCAAPELTRILASPKSAMRGLKEEDVAGLDVVAVQDGPVAAAVHAGEPVRGRVEVPEGVVVELIQKLIEVGDLTVEGVVGELEVGELEQLVADPRRDHTADMYSTVGQLRHLLGECVRRREERVVAEREHSEARHGEKRGPRERAGEAGGGEVELLKLSERREGR
jgi:hypothetical protein